jgi:hypothetical protein
MKLVDLMGLKFGRLTVISRSENNRLKYYGWSIERALTAPVMRV